MAKKHTKPEDFIQNAYYKGGDEALKAFINTHLQYPEAALAAGVEGTVHVKFQVNHQGEVTQAKALTHIGHGLEAEAVRLALLLRYEVPQRIRHLRVTYNKTLYIHFKLPQQPAPATEAATQPAPTPAMEVHYQWTPDPDNTTASHSYTIYLP